VDPARRAERALAAAQASFQAGPSTPPGCCVPAVPGSFTGAVFIDFLGRLLRDCGERKVHLIVDGHPVHRARLVSAWVAG
jgi:DDE superfamily endonuclease